MTELWSVLGIVVSVGLFLIGYRQTIGAKKERAINANQEVEKILLRRIVLEGYAPDVSSVARLLEGKARDFRVRPGDLLSEEQVLNSIFTRVLEIDFLPQEKREQILNQLTPTIVKAEKEPSSQEPPAAVESTDRHWSVTVVLAIMGLLTSFIGSAVVAFPKFANLDTNSPRLFSTMVGTIAVSVAIIAVLIFFYRFKESQREETSKEISFTTGQEFEREVANLLVKAGAQLQVATQNTDYDFRVTLGDRIILVEVKRWNKPMPIRFVAHIAERLRQAMKREGASEAIIVTPSPINVPSEAAGPDVRLLTLRELRNYIVHR
jgi:hypothetical protein